MSPALASPSANRAAVEVIEAIVRDAAFKAELTARFLDQFETQLLKSGRRRAPVAFPRAFLLELGAILRLAVWERAGILGCLERGLPGAEEALADLFARFSRGPQDAQSDGEKSALVLEVFKISLNRLALSGRSELQADIVMNQPDDEAYLDALADLLWKHRHLGRGEE